MHARPRSTNLNSHLHVLRPGAPLRNKVQPTTVMKLCVTMHMCQMVVAGERYFFYFGIFICGATLSYYTQLVSIGVCAWEASFK